MSSRVPPRKARTTVRTQQGGFVTYELTIETRPGYLHFIVTGDNTRENVVRYMEEVVRECTLRQCFRALIEERLRGPATRARWMSSRWSPPAATRFLRTLQAMAYVDVNARSQEMMQFAENVAVNRAFPVRVFPTVTAAERWLQTEQQHSISTGAAAAVGSRRRRFAQASALSSRRAHHDGRSAERRGASFGFGLDRTLISARTASLAGSFSYSTR